MCDPLPPKLKMAANFRFLLTVINYVELLHYVKNKKSRNMNFCN